MPPRRVAVDDAALEAIVTLADHAAIRVCARARTRSRSPPRRIRRADGAADAARLSRTPRRVDRSARASRRSRVSRCCSSIPIASRAWNDTLRTRGRRRVAARDGGRLARRERSRDDLAARNGGDEFCVVFADAEKSQAVERAESLRRAIETLDVRALASGAAPSADVRDHARASAWPPFRPMRRRRNDLLERADAAMYHSKRERAQRRLLLRHRRRLVARHAPSRTRSPGRAVRAVDVLVHLATARFDRRAHLRRAGRAAAARRRHRARAARFARGVRLRRRAGADGRRRRRRSCARSSARADAPRAFDDDGLALARWIADDVSVLAARSARRDRAWPTRCRASSNGSCRSAPAPERRALPERPRAARAAASGAICARHLARRRCCAIPKRGAAATARR